MTIQEALDLMRGVLNDDATTKFWPDSDLIQFLDQGQRMFLALASDDVTSGFQTTTLLTLSAGTTSLTVADTALPTNCFQPRLARIRWNTTGRFRTAQTVPLERLYALERSESTGAGIQDSPQVAFWAHRVYVSPVSTGAISEGIQLFYSLTLTQLATLTDAFSINAVHHPILCEWGLSQAFQKIGDNERTGIHRENFLTYIDGINGRWMGRNQAQPAPKRIATGDDSRGV